MGEYDSVTETQHIERINELHQALAELVDACNRLKKTEWLLKQPTTIEEAFALLLVLYMHVKSYLEVLAKAEKTLRN